MMKYNLEFNFGNLPEPPKSSDSIFYHYCSMKSLEAILRTNTIRLYDLQSMNDPSELYIRSVNFSELIANIYQKNYFDFEYTCNGMKCNMLTYLKALDIKYSLFSGGQHNTMSFALCLSKQGNSLSQWRLYGDNGNGVCLGFSKYALEEYTSTQQDALWQKVDYKSDFREFCEKIATDILDNIRKIYSSGDKEELSRYQTTMFDKIFNEASQYKIADYRDEDEYRLVVQKNSKLILPNATPDLVVNEKFIDDSMGFDVMQNKIRAFKTIPLDQLGLSSITLGPKNETTKQMLSLLLAKNGLTSPIEIYKSKIPYRG